MTATTHLTTDDQYRLVYQGIAAVAANCDGAVEDDGVGFNGQDTKFGRRIASVGFDEWTEDIKAEAARIASRYRKQIEASTGIDITTLPVVQEANDYTNAAARDQARQIDRRQQGQSLTAERKIVRGADGQVAVYWANKDPEFNALLAGVRRLPGRRWTGSCNVVDATPQVLVFAEEYGFQVEDGARNAITTRATEPAVPAEAKPNIVLDGDRVRISFDYDAALVSGVRRLPGRAYDGSSKTNTADLHPEVLAFADEFNLVVDPAVVEAINNLGASKAEAQTEAQIRRAVSALANPADLPEEFVNRVLAATAKAQVV